MLALENFIEDTSDDGDDDEDEGEDEDEDDEEEVQKSAKKKVSRTDSDSDDDLTGRREEDEEDVEGWGSSKRDYYGGDAVETEQGAVEEEAEALRLQAKQLSAMNEADFMFDEDDWKAEEKESKDEEIARVGKALVVTEELPTVIPETMGVAERMKILKSRHPEFEPLAEEFAELQPLHQPLSLSAAAAEAVGETVKSSVAIVKFRALSAYLGVLSMYFAVLSSPDIVQTQGMKIREHGVMEGLVKCREMWGAVKDLDVEEIRSKAERKRKALVDASGDSGKALTVVPSKQEKKADRKSKNPGEPKRKRAKLSESDSDAPARKSPKKRSSKLDDLSDLTHLATSFKPTPKSVSKPANKATANTTAGRDGDDFGDDIHLTSLDAEQKVSRRRNLRFHTSQIVSKSAKREIAGRDAGGDTDIPHKERHKEKELRLAAEAARRKNSGATLDDDDFNEEDKRVAKQMKEQLEDSGNEYYDMLAGKSKQKKAEKKAYHDAEKVGGVVVPVEQNVAGKRAIGYVIEKNKGLTPHRKKDVRNPRVKKRKKYEEAKKKLGSKKALYKGGQQGAYAGELTGIKKNLVKSVKLA